MSTADLATKPWDTIELHRLSSEEIERLIHDPKLVVYELHNPADYSYPEHMHARSQALLVTKGSMTHFSNGKAYTQHPGDLLIVPARLKHHAQIGPQGVDALFLQQL